MNFESNAALYKKGIAVGQSNIYQDIMNFRYKKEEFIFPTMAVFNLMSYNGYFYTAPVKKLRALLRVVQKGNSKGNSKGK